MIVFAIRSGSTLVCNDLARAGLGLPTEHFQGPLVPDPVAPFVERLVASDAPVFGTKLSWEQTFALLRRLADAGQIGAFDLREVFGEDVRFIRLVRRNKVRQTVSAWRAASSGVWHLPSGSAPDNGDPAYDPDALRALLLQLLAEDWLWERHLGDIGADALTVTYEDYVQDRVGWIAEIARHVGQPAHIPVLVDQTLPMADQWTNRLEQRLMDDLSAPTHPFWAVPSLQGCVPASLRIEQCIPLPRAVPSAPETTIGGPAG